MRTATRKTKDGFLRSDRSQPPDPRKNDSTHEIDLGQIDGLAEQATQELRTGELGLVLLRVHNRLAGERRDPAKNYA